MNERKWFLRTQDETFGPESRDTLVEWAKLGRIQPGQEVSDDGIIWTKVEEVPFLDMRFSIDIGDGNPRGPFNKAAADALIASGRLPMSATVIETREPFPPEDAGSSSDSGPSPEPEPAADPGPTAEAADVSRSPSAVEPEPEPEVKVVEKIVEKEVRVEVPVEKIVEKEIRVEVPVEKIVEKVVTVVDDTRVRELEGLLEEERARVTSLQGKLDENSKAASGQRNEIARLEGEIRNGAERERLLEERLVDAATKLEQSVKDSSDREAKLTEQIAALEDELRRLPQAASEVADIQAAMYGLMTKESEEIEQLLAQEKAEAEAFRKRCEARCERLNERRREILRRSGANIADMTRKSLLERPEDPRTAQLRRELDELRRQADQKAYEAASRIRELESVIRDYEAAASRSAEDSRDIADLRRENTDLRERLQARERELLAERELAEEIRQREAASQQAMIARLQTLESPSIGLQPAASTNQSREARQVKIPGWMRIGVGRR